MFEKLVAIEPVSLIPSAEEELHRYAKAVVLYRDVPASDDEMVRRCRTAELHLPHGQGSHRAVPQHPLYRDVLQPIL